MWLLWLLCLLGRLERLQRLERGGGGGRMHNRGCHEEMRGQRRVQPRQSYVLFVDEKDRCVDWHPASTYDREEVGRRQSITRAWHVGGWLDDGTTVIMASRAVLTRRDANRDSVIAA